MNTRAVVSIGTLALLALVPAVAFGGTATNGLATVNLDVGVKPAKAGTSSKPRSVSFSYKESLTANDGLREPDNILEIKVGLQKGFRFDVGAVPQCKESVLEDPNQGPSACPPKSIVGTGTAIADARPLLADPLGAKITAFNGMLDTDVNGNPRAAVPALLLVAEVSSLGVKAYLPAEIRGSSLVLDLAPADPAMPSPYVIRDVSLALRKAGSAKKPYLRAPTSCPKSGWVFSQTILFEGGVAPITAKDKVGCSAD